ncbi:hypothetical protein [Acinetobacter boissieri]|uniref:Uncharacterized protein n=1 Tax=Acinetobacter boissieri TaxID=1219383 RepID=A0A1G6GYP1_9GAMM|nr:hypothetical protein [Acinetobacter boissieri]SDB86993.1 hypothetical protein SAMN05421733_10327 [Acinetobacter boissieri]
MADAVVANMDTIHVKANPDTPKISNIGPWAGMAGDQAQGVFSELYGLDVLSMAHFGVTLEAFYDDAEIVSKQVDLYSSFDLKTMLSRGYAPAKSPQNIPLIDPDFKLMWLATNIDLSTMDAQSDSVHVGHYQLNYFTTNGTGDISITFIETRNASIINSAKAIKSVMFREDGTQALPKDYLMRLKIYIFDKHSNSTRPFEVEHIVALQAANLPLETSMANGVGMVTLNFTKMFPMLA